MQAVGLPRDQQEHRALLRIREPHGEDLHRPASEAALLAAAHVRRVHRRAGLEDLVAQRAGLRAVVGPLVLVHHVARGAVRHHRALVEEHRAGAEGDDGGVVVGDQEHRSPAGGELPHAVRTLPLEAGVPHRQGLVHDEHVRIDGHRGAEGEAGLHAARIGPERLVDELLQLAEGDDLRLLAPHLLRGHAQAEAAHADVLAPGVVRVEAGPQLQDGGQTPLHRHASAGGGERAREDLQERALAGAVVAHEAQHLAARDLEIHAPQGPEGLVARPAEEPLLQHRAAGGVDPEALADVRAADRGGGAHSRSPKSGRSSQKMRAPRAHETGASTSTTTQLHGCWMEPNQSESWKHHTRCEKGLSFTTH